MLKKKTDTNPNPEMVSMEEEFLVPQLLVLLLEVLEVEL